MDSLIKLTPYIDIGFWKELTRRKLDEWKLDDSARNVYGKYQVQKFKDINCKLNFDVYSFELPSFPAQGPIEVYLKGKVKIFNTIEEFESINKEQIIKELKKLQEEGLSGFSYLSESSSYDYFCTNYDWFFMTIFCCLKTHVFKVNFYQPCHQVSLKNQPNFQWEFITTQDFALEEKCTKFQEQLKDLSNVVCNSALFTFDDEYQISINHNDILSGRD